MLHINTEAGLAVYHLITRRTSQVMKLSWRHMRWFSGSPRPENLFYILHKVENIMLHEHCSCVSSTHCSNWFCSHILGTLTSLQDLVKVASLVLQSLQTCCYIFHIDRELKFLLYTNFLSASLGSNSCKHVFTCCTLKQRLRKIWSWFNLVFYITETDCTTLSFNNCKHVFMCYTLKPKQN